MKIYKEDVFNLWERKNKHKRGYELTNINEYINYAVKKLGVNRSKHIDTLRGFYKEYITMRGEK